MDFFINKNDEFRKMGARHQDLLNAICNFYDVEPQNVTIIYRGNTPVSAQVQKTIHKFT